MENGRWRCIKKEFREPRELSHIYNCDCWQGEGEDKKARVEPKPKRKGDREKDARSKKIATVACAELLVE